MRNGKKKERRKRNRWEKEKEGKKRILVMKVREEIRKKRKDK